MFCHRRTWIYSLLALAVSHTNAFAWETLVQQLNWTVGIGTYGLGVRGYEDMTSLCYGPGQFNVSVSGHSFLACAGLALAIFSASMFYLLWQRTKAKPPAEPVADR